MSLDRYVGSTSGGGTQDVNIVSPDPLPVEQQGPVTVDDSTPIDVAVTNAVNVDDSTPIDVNLASPDPVNVLFSNPQIQLSLNKGNMTSLGGGRYYFAQPLGDIARFANIAIRFNITTPFGGVNVQSQIFDTVGDGRLAPVTQEINNTMANAGANQVSHKYVTKNNFQPASNAVTVAFTPFTNAATFWQIGGGRTVDTITFNTGLTTTSVMYMVLNVTGADPDFDLYADITHLDP